MRLPDPTPRSERHQRVLDDLATTPRAWLVTGAAGFIGSHLVERLLALEQTVVGLDNFTTGSRANVAAAVAAVPGSDARFRLVEGDVRDPADCRAACRDVDVVLHHAGIDSAARALVDPVTVHDVNVGGFLNVALAAREAKARKLVYASSSAVYGDAVTLPRIEERTGLPLTPHAAMNQADEAYAAACHRALGLPAVGLRYFDVFGPRQRSDGAYTGLIPRWVRAMLEGEPCLIEGDGETSRDFCYVANVVQANLLAAAATPAPGTTYNIASGESTTLNALFRMIRLGLAGFEPAAARMEPRHAEAPPDAARSSRADISRARVHLGYEPTHLVSDGLIEALGWYVEACAGRAPVPA